MRTASVFLARVAVAVLALVIASAPGEAAAQRSVGDSNGTAFVSAAFSLARVSSDATTRQSFGTYELGLGYRPWGFRQHRWSRLSWEFGLTAKSGGLEMPASASYPSDDASFSMLWVGLRLDVFAVPRSRWTPWVGVGAALAAVDGRESGRAEGGAGALWSFGSDVHLTRGLMLRGRLSTVDAGAVRSTAGSLALVLEIMRARHHRRPEWGEEVPPEPPQPEPRSEAPAPPPECDTFDYSCR